MLTKLGWAGGGSYMSRCENVRSVSEGGAEETQGMQHPYLSIMIVKTPSRTKT